MTDKLAELCRRFGFNPSDSEIFGVLDALFENLNGYFEYHCSRMAELLGGVFLALNAEIDRRFVLNGRTNDCRQITHVPGISSDYFRDMYTSTLVFRNYPASRIVGLTPTTAPSFRGTYNFGHGIEMAPTQ